MKSQTKSLVAQSAVRHSAPEYVSALTRVLKFRLPVLTIMASVVAREYAGLREEFSRINMGEPGYVSELEIWQAPSSEFDRHAAEKN